VNQALVNQGRWSEAKRKRAMSTGSVTATAAPSASMAITATRAGPEVGSGASMRKRRTAYPRLANSTMKEASASTHSGWTAL